MLRIIGCDSCGTESSLPVEFKFTVSTICCKSCSKMTTKDWTFHFCNITCFSTWFDKIRNLGVPCMDCSGTGFQSGFESNGVCPTCNGTKYVSVTKTNLGV